MEIRFNTKEESNRLQEEEFMALSPSERVIRFLILSAQINQFPKKESDDKKNNFTIEKKKND